MCLAVPSKIISISGQEAEVEAGGVIKRASLVFLQNAKIGEYVLLHAGFAIQKVDPQAAKESLDAWKELDGADN